MTLRFGKQFFPGSDGLHKWTFWAYVDGFNWEKDPIVMFMELIGVPTKNLIKGNECFIFYFCVLCSAGYANYFVYVLFRYFGVSDNSFSCFYLKAF